MLWNFAFDLFAFSTKDLYVRLYALDYCTSCTSDLYEEEHIKFIAEQNIFGLKSQIQNDRYFRTMLEIGPCLARAIMLVYFKSHCLFQIPRQHCCTLFLLHLLALISILVTPEFSMVTTRSMSKKPDTKDGGERCIIMTTRWTLMDEAYCIFMKDYGKKYFEEHTRPPYMSIIPDEAVDALNLEWDDMSKKDKAQYIKRAKEMRAAGLTLR